MKESIATSFKSFKLTSRAYTGNAREELRETLATMSIFR